MKLSSLAQPSIETEGRTFFIDTGSNGAIKLNTDFFEQYPKSEIKYIQYGASSTGGGGYGANDSTYICTIPKLPIAHVELHNPSIEVKRNTSPLLGNALFKYFTVKMDYINKKFAMIPSSIQPVLNTNLYNLSVVLRDNKLIVGERTWIYGEEPFEKELIGWHIVKIGEKELPDVVTSKDFCELIFGRSLAGQIITIENPADGTRKKQTITIQ